MKNVITTAFVLAALFAGAADAAEATDAQKLAGNVCEKCHGPNGTSASPLFPRLAGQPQAYLETQLKLFRDHSRGDPHARAYMWGIAGPLSDAEIKGLAELYGKLPPTPGTPAADPALAAKGKALYDAGAVNRDIPACAGCHGQNAEGNEAIPRLAGQHRQYLIRQLQAVHGLARENEIMDENAKYLNEEDIAAVTEYLSSK